MLLASACILSELSGVSAFNAPLVHIQSSVKTRGRATPHTLRMQSVNRRDSIGILLATAGMLAQTKEVRAKDVADGGLPGGLAEYMSIIKSKKQVLLSSHFHFNGP